VIQVPASRRKIHQKYLRFGTPKSEEPDRFNRSGSIKPGSVAGGGGSTASGPYPVDLSIKRLWRECLRGKPVPGSQKSFSGYRTATKRPGGETDYQQREEYKEKDFGDRRGGAGDAEKPKKTGDQRQDQKGQ
jgi:hypothetical protein